MELGDNDRKPVARTLVLGVGGALAVLWVGFVVVLSLSVAKVLLCTMAGC